MEQLLMDLFFLQQADQMERPVVLEHQEGPVVLDLEGILIQLEVVDKVEQPVLLQDQ